MAIVNSSPRTEVRSVSGHAFTIAELIPYYISAIIKPHQATPTGKSSEQVAKFADMFSARKS
jgi:hypothetical protein